MRRVSQAALSLAVVAAALTVAVGGVAQLGSDFDITQLQTAPPSPGPATDVGFRSNVTGPLATCQNPQVRYVLDNGTVDLNASVQTTNGTAWGDADWSATVGAHVLNATLRGCPDDPRAGNNFSELRFRIGPDLTPTGITVTPEEPLEGENVTFEATVANVGPHDATGSFRVLALVDGQIEAERAVQGLGAGDERTVTIGNWTAEPGQKVTNVLIEPDQVTEITQENNTLQGPTLTVEDAAPDLEAAGIQIDPAFPSPGETVRIQATVRNEGDLRAPASTTELTLDGEPLPPANQTPPLDPQEQAVAAWSWQAEAGVVELIARADAPDAVNESDETDNAANRTLVVGPDLLVEELAIRPEDPVAGDPVRLRVTVANVGSAVDGAFEVALAIDGTPVTSERLEGLAAESTARFTFGPVNVSEGRHTVTVSVDPRQKVDEAREGNNRAERAIRVPRSRANLVVTELDLVQRSVAPGEPLAFNATVTNRGGNASGAFDLAFRIDGELLGDPHQVPSLPPGTGTQVTSANWTAQEGTHTLTVLADPGQPNGSIAESDEGDNRARLRFAIGPDLSAASIELVPERPRLGENVTIEAGVVNEGTQAAGAFSVRIEAGETVLHEASRSGLGPRERTQVNTTWTAARGVEELRLVVDTRDQVEEVNETNNGLSHPLEVDTSVPDLAASNLSAVPSTPLVGENVSFRLEVANRGQQASERTTVRFRVNGSLLDEVEIPAIEPGQNLTLRSANWTAVLGGHNVTAAVDPNDSVAEPPARNNRARLTVEVVTGGSGIPGAGVLLVLPGLLAAALIGRQRR